MSIFKKASGLIAAPVLVLVFFSFLAGYADVVLESLNLSSAIIDGSTKAILCFAWLSGAWLFNRLLRLLFWDGIIKATLGRSAPRLAVQLTGVLVFFLGLTGIVSSVFNQSVTAMWATSGAIGIVIGFALRNLILDTFSGLAIHLERPFMVGHWIKVHTRMGEYIGRVEETNWRTTRLWTTSRNLVIIPNSFLTTTLVTNFSMPDTVARFELDFVLDFSVPTERGIRVLSAALVHAIGSKGPLANPAPKVRVTGTTDYGVKYSMRYYLEPIDESPSKARNTIVQSVLEHIQQAGLTLSYPRQDVFYARMPWRQKGWTYLKDQVRQLRSLSLFTELDDGELEFIAKHMTVHKMEDKDIVVHQGDTGESMFVLAEGLLEVLIKQQDGTQIKVADLAPGTFFGEKSLLTGDPRSATILCVAESMICEITKPCISELLQRNPALADTLSRAVVERDMHNEIALSRATKEEVAEKVSAVIGAFAGRLKTFFGIGASD